MEVAPPLRGAELDAVASLGAAGDREAAQAAILGVAPLLRAKAKRFAAVYPEHDVDDLAQEAVLRALKSLPAYRPEAGKCATFLGRSAELHLRTVVRKRHPREVSLCAAGPIDKDGEREDLDVEDKRTPSPDRRAEDDDLLESAFGEARVHGWQRSILERRAAGESRETIAATMGRTARDVERVEGAARARLREVAGRMGERMRRAAEPPPQ